MRYVPIEDHGIIGNMHSAALVGLDGSMRMGSMSEGRSLGCVEGCVEGCVAWRSGWGCD